MAPPNQRTIGASYRTIMPWTSPDTWSVDSGALDVADEAFELRRGRVLWSASPTQVELIPRSMQAFLALNSTLR